VHGEESAAGAQPDPRSGQGGADASRRAERGGLADRRPGGGARASPSTRPNKWKRLQQIFAIDLHGVVDYFPGYGLDPAGYRPRAPMGQVLKVFGGAKDGWGLAGWFLAVNSVLGGRRPQDLLATKPERVIAAAQDEMDAVARALAG